MTRNAAPAIRARGLVKRFGDLEAVAGIDLDVPRGMIFAILGPNGAGKTTLMRMLATLARPDSGTANVMGYDVLSEPDAVRGAIAMTGQFASLDEDLTGRDNLVFLARLWGFGRKAARGRAEDLLAAFELTEARHRQVTSPRHRRLADRDAGRAVPRRADDRARSDGAAEGVADDPAAGAIRRHRAAHDAIPRRSGPACRADRRDRSRTEDRRRHQPGAQGRDRVGLPARHAHRFRRSGPGGHAARRAAGVDALSGLVTAGIALEDFAMGSPSLEEVFFALTDGTAAQSEDAA